MNGTIAASRGRSTAVQFRSLTDLFGGSSDARTSAALAGDLALPPISHHMDTKIDPMAERCRQILMAGFQADSDALRTRISAGEPAIVALYRGFSKFMLEDLNNNQYTAHMSRSQRRKLATKVAFEMIEVSPSALACCLPMRC